MNKFIEKWTKRLADSINREIDQEISVDLREIKPEDCKDYRKQFADEFKQAVKDLNQSYKMN